MTPETATEKQTDAPQRRQRFRRTRAFFSGIARHIDVWRIAWAEQKRQGPTILPKGRELEFLPAVLELQETPPSPVGRAIGGLIIFALVSAVVWTAVGKIDIVAVAQGKIIPSDYSKVIQPLESGIIKRIRVRDGQSVKKGDILIELDLTTAGADRERLSNEYHAALTEAARLRALMADRDQFVPPRGADPNYVAIQRRQLKDQLTEIRAMESQADSLRQLYDKQLVSKLQYMDSERARAEKAQQHAADLSNAETRAHSLSKELAKAAQRTTQHTLTAPIDGVVQQLAVHTIGGVVTPAQELMVIAPNESQLDVEAWIENKDIGFVETGQEAEIKVESFPFTRFGVIEGKILHLSHDAVPLERVGLVYAARVSMSKTVMHVASKEVRLSPGMNVTVEIKTGQRRLIEFFLSPLIRGIKETARER